MTAHCEWRQRRRFKLDVVVFFPSGAAFTQLVFEAPPSVQDIRKKVGAAGVARVELKPDCASRPQRLSGRVTDALLITSDATVTFGQAPTSMFVLQDDGGMCMALAPPYLSDGGLDLRAAQTECAAR
jgi:hypothetical protein